ncbi:hypothetical protein AYO21_02851 [Fonsecaea monophora]|uniref:Uncharacterized protein n=1 Tax=Fonsecaea monophora TaxID=254056 RepID=A0A177FH12_9EURO|nr:hypothetical protein AYO21_02851 [Fonsecaea monophora]OAG42900.1 hypothetical protein AYO21_02851 [Fonsecaea monophora]
MSSSSTRCALVTGGACTHAWWYFVITRARNPATRPASGMGLSVVQDLVSQGWNVEIVDLDVKMGRDAEAQLGQKVHFTRANVVDYEQQASAFAQAWKRWGRIDLGMMPYTMLSYAPGHDPVGGGVTRWSWRSILNLIVITVFANAGILDRTDFSAPAPEDDSTGAPPKPDVLTVDVCLYGAIWSSYLALHFFRKSPDRTGRLVITSSQGGIYPTPLAPLYGCAKTGIVGLVRSLGLRIKTLGDPITVNCICPGLVPTPLANTALLAAIPEAMQTPTSTIIEAVNLFINDASLSGQVAECSGTDVILREGLPYANAAAEYMGEGKSADRIDFAAAVADIRDKARQYDQKLSMVG